MGLEIESSTILRIFMPHCASRGQYGCYLLINYRVKFAIHGGCVDLVITSLSLSLLSRFLCSFLLKNWILTKSLLFLYRKGKRSPVRQTQVQRDITFQRYFWKPDNMKYLAIVVAIFGCLACITMPTGMK